MDALVLTIRPPLTRNDLPGLFARVCALLDGVRAGSAVDCHVDGVAADAVALDAFSRLQLAARRRGCLIVLRGAAPDLLALIALAGLDGALPVG